MNTIKFNGEVNEMSGNWFVSEVEKLPQKCKAVIHLNTPGGEIYTGNHMINAIEDAVRTKGCKFQIVVGSIAASMGASLVAAVKASGGEVVAHKNSELMFHGCWGITVGGATELTESAKAMKDFNDSVIANLKKIGIADCEGWFDANHEHWLKASEAKEIGLVDSILGEDAETSDGITHDCAHRLAALLVKPSEAKTEDEPKAKTEDEPKAKTEEKPKSVENWEERYKGASKKINELQDKIVELERASAANESTAATVKDLNDKLGQSAKDLAAANAKVSDLTAKLEKSEKDLVESRDELAKSQEHAKKLEDARQLLTAGVLTPSAEGSSYADKMKAAKTPEEREALREQKRMGKIK